VAVTGTFHASSARLAWGGVKEFADGSLGSSTALLWEPYADAPSEAGGQGGDHTSNSGQGGSTCPGHTCGTRTIPTDELRQLVSSAAAAGLQVAVHAIGERAVDEVLQVFEAADKSGSSSSGRVQHRIEHMQHLSSPAAAAKAAALGVAGVPNPQHLLTDAAMLMPKLGAARSGPGRAFAYKTLVDAGVALGFGSDWPVVEVEPWVSCYAAVCRQDPPSAAAQTCAAGDGGGSSSSSSSGCGSQDGAAAQPPAPWSAQVERLGLHEVLLRHTLHAARVARLDHWVGALRPGLRADFIVLDRSPFEDDRQALAGGSSHQQGRSSGGCASFAAGLPVVRETWMDGACVFGCDRH
jgi:predicted amidohydrolase YtcJ